MLVCRHAYMLVRWQAVTPVCRCMCIEDELYRRVVNVQLIKQTAV